jgi:hypothetical protein
VCPNAAIRLFHSMRHLRQFSDLSVSSGFPQRLLALIHGFSEEKPTITAVSMAILHQCLDILLGLCSRKDGEGLHVFSQAGAAHEMVALLNVDQVKDSREHWLCILAIMELLSADNYNVVLFTTQPMVHLLLRLMTSPAVPLSRRVIVAFLLFKASCFDRMHPCMLQANAIETLLTAVVTSLLKDNDVSRLIAMYCCKAVAALAEYTTRVLRSQEGWRDALNMLNTLKPLQNGATKPYIDMEPAPWWDVTATDTIKMCGDAATAVLRHLS